MNIPQILVPLAGTLRAACNSRLRKLGSATRAVSDCPCAARPCCVLTAPFAPLRPAPPAPPATHVFETRIGAASYRPRRPRDLHHLRYQSVGGAGGVRQTNSR